MLPLTLLVLLSAQSSGDTTKHFHGICTLHLLGQPTQEFICLSEDLSTPGYNNRLHILLAGAEDVPSLPRFADYIGIGATTAGTMQLSADLWGYLEMTPANRHIQVEMKTAAGAFEVRPQNLTVTHQPDGTLEMLIDEPYGDFDGKTPSTDWVQRCLQSHALLGGAH